MKLCPFGVFADLLVALGGNENVYLSDNVGVQTNVCGKVAKGLDGLVKSDLSLVELYAELLFELLCDILGGYRAVKLLIELNLA